MKKKYTIGLDYGTNSVRCVIVDIYNGIEIATAVWNYESGDKGIILDQKDHNLARQNPADYIKGFMISITEVLKIASQSIPEFSSSNIIGMGVDTTGSTPMPVDESGVPLSMLTKFSTNPNAMAWLWKDHTAYAEAAEITELAKKEKPEYLDKCGGVYSSEWFFSKILHCRRRDPEVFQAAFSWVECCDFIPALLTGNQKPEKIRRSRCAAGHKAMFNDDWGGLPSEEFLAKLDPEMAALRSRLYDGTCQADEIAGHLTDDWAKKLGLTTGLPVAIGAFDAHLGAIGSGIKPGTLVKIIGTSTCDIVISDKPVEKVPGICGIVKGSVLPDVIGLEAGQSAVGDIFNWFVEKIQPGGAKAGSHEELTRKAAELKPGESGLLALDWNNGNRTVLVDQRLTGLLIGQTLHTRPEEIYRALIESTAFGALVIINRFEENGIAINEVVNCGGISEKNELIMQIYADITNREMKISHSAQTCALGSAVAAAVAAGTENGGYEDFAAAQSNMCCTRKKVFKPIAEHHAIYSKLFRLYMQLHDGFGLAGKVDLYNVMKDLLAVKEEVKR
ncbi:MAG: ribulokinase [Candidatus Marinimicrobia bacterium]|nr:ribulokinase [Candidatus Neomarinimicrobiota bacterium]